MCALGFDFLRCDAASWMRRTTLILLTGHFAALAQKTNQSLKAPDAKPLTNRAPIVEVQPIAPPSNLLTSITVKRGFQVQVAAEVQGGVVALAWDGMGRAFVATRRHYEVPAGVNSEPGRVMVLEDRDGDGVFETKTDFADELPGLSALACYDGGVFVASGQQIVYLKETGGSLSRKTIFSGFGNGSGWLGPQRLLNSFKWGLDNRIHGGAAGIGGAIVIPEVKGMAPVNLGRRDFSFDPRSVTITPEPGGAVSGLCFDSSGRKFVSDFVRPLSLVLRGRQYAERNPWFVPMESTVTIEGPQTKVFTDALTAAAKRPGSRAPTAAAMPVPWTEARGCVVYQGSAFPSTYLDNVFIAEPRAHVIHHLVLRDNSISVTASRATDEASSEFVSSRDPLFQPMQLANAPDGTLVVADFHGGATGRILRIMPMGFRTPKPAELEKARIYDLVANLASTNGWNRDTAARLILERQDKDAIPLLTNMLARSQLPLARLRALCALDSLTALNDLALLKALRDSDARVREQAVRLSEKFNAGQGIGGRIADTLVSMNNDPSPRVRYQLALTLGDAVTPAKTQALVNILTQDPDNLLLQSAVMSSVGNSAAELLLTLVNTGGWAGTASREAFLAQLATMVGTQGAQPEVNRVLAFYERPQTQIPAAYPLLSQLGIGLRRCGLSLDYLDPQGQLQRFTDQSMNTIYNRTLPNGPREAAARYYSLMSYADYDIESLMVVAQDNASPQAVRSAAIVGLGRVENPFGLTNMMSRWSNLTPIYKANTVEALMQRVDHFPLLIGYLENGTIRPSDLTPAERNILRTLNVQVPVGPGGSAAIITDRAVKVLGPLVVRRPQTVGRLAPLIRGARAGDPGRGRTIFNERCAGCHTLGDQGRAYGPDLSGARTWNREKLLSALVEPSANMPAGYITGVALTKGQDLTAGILTDDNQRTVTLLPPGQAGVVLPKSNLQFVQVQAWSVMPEALEQEIGDQGVGDLIEFLTTY